MVAETYQQRFGCVRGAPVQALMLCATGFAGNQEGCDGCAPEPSPDLAVHFQVEGLT